MCNQPPLSPVPEGRESFPRLFSPYLMTLVITAVWCSLAVDVNVFYCCNITYKCKKNHINKYTQFQNGFFQLLLCESSSRWPQCKQVMESGCAENQATMSVMLNSDFLHLDSICIHWHNLIPLKCQWFFSVLYSCWIIMYHKISAGISVTWKKLQV